MNGEDLAKTVFDMATAQNRIAAEQARIAAIEAEQAEINRRLHMAGEPKPTKDARLLQGIIAALAWLESDREIRNGSPCWHAAQELRRALAEARTL